MTVTFQSGVAQITRDFDAGTTLGQALEVVRPALNVGTVSAVSNGVEIGQGDAIDGFNHIQLHAQSHSKAV
jgi:hypothetical protein